MVVVQPFPGDLVKLKSSFIRDSFPDDPDSGPPYAVRQPYFRRPDYKMLQHGVLPVRVTGGQGQLRGWSHPPRLSPPLPCSLSG